MRMPHWKERITGKGEDSKEESSEERPVNDLATLEKAIDLIRQKLLLKPEYSSSLYLLFPDKPSLAPDDKDPMSTFPKGGKGGF